MRKTLLLAPRRHFAPATAGAPLSPFQPAAHRHPRAVGLKPRSDRKACPRGPGDVLSELDRSAFVIDAKPVLARRHLAATVVAAILAGVIGMGLLSNVAGMFQRDGSPLERVVVAERACSHYAFESERMNCVSMFLVNARLQRVAKE